MAEGLRWFLAAVLLNGSQKKIIFAISVCSSDRRERAREKYYTPHQVKIIMRPLIKQLKETLK
jgi:hypothetical protein